MAMADRSLPPRRSNGCLWGCVAVIVILALPAVIAAGTWTWFLWQGYRHDPAVRLARELVERDGIARQVLGTPITVTGVEGNAWSWVPGQGQTSAAILSLSGPRGEGTLEIHSHRGQNGLALDEATLTGPSGQRYDLLHHSALPGGRDWNDTI
jgi:hypothetical protein